MGRPKKEQSTAAIEQKQETRPRTGRGGTHNFPNAKMDVKTTEDRALVRTLLTEVLVEYNQERVKSDEELAERLNNYFKRCAERGQIPTIEEMCLTTGYTMGTCSDWIYGRNKGFSPATSQIMKKSKEIVQTFDAKLVISGKLNFLAYCFRAKNYYGMTDKQEHIITPNVQTAADYSVEEIKKRYITDSSTIPDDPDEND